MKIAIRKAVLPAAESPLVGASGTTAKADPWATNQPALRWRIEIGRRDRTDDFELAELDPVGEERIRAPVCDVR